MAVVKKKTAKKASSKGTPGSRQTKASGHSPPRAYKPKPIPTRGVKLPEELAALTEQLAESTHDQWARQRTKDGWTWGPERNDSAKTHPCLVPYIDLPNSEKTYDRKTAMETLKAILVLGFEIRRRE